MQIDTRQYEFVIPNSLGWLYDSTSTQAASTAAPTSSGDSVSIGQSSRQQMEGGLTSLEQILKAKGCSMQDALKDILISGKYLQEYLDTGIVPSACPGYQKDSMTQTQDSLTSPQGMRVDVSTSYQDAVVKTASASVTRTNGQQVTFDAACNVRLNEREDGSLAVTFADTGETRIFAQDGSVTSEQGTAGALSGTDGDDVFLQLTSASSIDAGNGDDSILVLAGGGTTSAGAGNDTIVVGKAVWGTTSINAGSGNDTLRANELRRNVSIEMGDGDDTVDVQSYAGDMNLGQGNNTLTAHDAAGRLSAGDGSNTVTANNNMGAMIFGDGNNQITTNSCSGNMTFGKGNNTVTGDLWLGGSITAKDGNNTINFDSIFTGGNIIVGKGDNHIRIRSLDGNIIAGNGNNIINVDSMASSNSSAMRLGHGDNTVTVRSTSGKIQMGDGNNTLRWDSAMDASIKIGNGNNTVIGGSQGLCDNLVLGDGNNTLELSTDNRAFTRAASNVLGNGQNSIFLGGYGAQVTHGSGNMTQEQIQARNDANQAFMDNWHKSNFG